MPCRFARLLRSLVLLFAGWGCVLMGATITVVNTNDSGGGSLRQAISDAIPGDSITFNLSAHSTIALGSSLSINKNLTITGPGADLLTIDGGSGWSSHPFVLPSSGNRILDISAGTITITGLRFQNGYVSGAGDAGAATGANGAAIRVLNNASLTIDACWFSYNHAKDRSDDPPVGGAIHLDQGTLTVTNSSFHDNYAGAGSAVSNYAGVVHFTNCTLSSNVAYSGGAFVHVPAGKTSTLDHCTVVDNTCLNSVDSAGLSIINGNVVITNSIIAANSIGQRSGPTVHYGDLDPNWDGTGAVGSLGGNILGNPGDVTFTEGSQDHVGSWATPLDAKLNDLNLTLSLGGHSPYHAPMSNSPAINNGLDTGGTDQRGIARIGQADSGSCEYIPVTISGNAGIAGVTLSYTDEDAKTATSDGSGNYSFTVAPQWSGTVTPSMTGYVFTPVSRTYSNLLTDQTNQDFVAHLLIPPTITSAAGTTFQIGSAGSFTVTTSGYPIGASMVIQKSGSLPTGVTFTDNNNGTATLSGTPAAGSNHSYSITIRANNGIAPNASQDFTLTVNQAPAITSANHFTFTVGTPGTFTVTTSGYPDAASMAISETGALPTGLTFADNHDGTATLEGTPAASTGGSYALTITANNGVSPNGSQSFTLTVNQAPAITSTNGVAFTETLAGSFTITTTGFPTGNSMAITETGSLPSGVTFTNNHDGTATLAGTPANSTSGSYPITITANNGVGSDATQNFTLTIDRIQPSVTTGAASSITSAGATLNGTVNAHGTSTTALFRLGTASGSYTTSFGATPGTVTGTSDTSISANLSSLQPDTKYYFVAEGNNGGDPVRGSELFFTTPKEAPTATTTAATSVTANSATLNATVNARNSDTTVTFEYGLTASLGTSVAATPSSVSGTVDATPVYNLGSLAPNTTYYFEVVTTNAGGTTRGGVLSFTTLGLAAITVTNANDSGAGSLRQAIADVATGGTIDFDPGLAGSTITLTTGQLAIAKNLTINGLSTSPGIAISGNNACRVIYISAGTVTLDNLTLQNGLNVPAMPGNIGGSGLFITNPGTTVTLNNCAVINNATIATPTVGGGIVVGTGSALQMNNCTVSGNNSSFDGGGILNQGTLAINACTIVNNSAPGGGGGLETITNTTTLRNTILAGNSGSSGPDGYTPLGFINSEGYNLIGSTANCTIVPGTGDVMGFSFASLLLGPLQNNGGPTQTHALLPGSPAIDAIPGCNGSPATDQRGIARPQGTACDVGAFEAIMYHTVTYDANGGSGSMAPQMANAATTLSTNAFTQLGFAFTGWNTNPTGGGTAYTNGAMYDFSSDMTLFAQWVLLQPSVSTSAASSITGTSVTLNGIVNAHDTSTTALFRLGTVSGTYTTSIGATPSPVTGAGDTSISANLPGLLPNTTYYFVAEGNNGGTPVRGTELSFTTATIAPTATTSAATDVAATGATLNGTVNAQNASTTVKFQWGPTNALGSEYAFSGSSTGMSDTTFNYPLSGLLPLTTYYYRIVATNAGGTTNGDTLTFTTSHMSSVVILNVTPSSGPVGTVITLTGSGFTNATSVIIGGMEAMFTVVSDTEITCVIPPGATTGPVTVTSPAGTGTSATSITVEQEG
jgi:hypothetical protein